MSAAAYEASEVVALLSSVGGKEKKFLGKHEEHILEHLLAPEIRKSQRRAKAQNWRPCIVVCAQLLLLTPLIAVFVFMDWSLSRDKMSLGASFVENFTASDSKLWIQSHDEPCLYVEGIDYCEISDDFTYNEDQGGMNLTMMSSSSCGCDSSNAAADHLQSNDYYGYGKLSTEVHPWITGTTTPGTLACVGGYSEISTRVEHDEVSFCWYVLEDSSTYDYGSISWWTGNYVHAIHVKFTQFDQDTGNHHKYAIEWTDDGFVWSINDVVLYERGNSTTDCGSGPAFSSEYYIGSEYSAYVDGNWDSFPFFTNKTSSNLSFVGSTCDFYHDKAAVISQPMQIHAIIRPYTSSAEENSALTGAIGLKHMVFDSYTKTWSKRWRDFMLSCVDDEGTTKVDASECYESWTGFLLSFFVYTIEFRWILLILAAGICSAQFVKLCALFGRKLSPSCTLYNLAPSASWTYVGVQGLLSRYIAGWPRVFLWFGTIGLILIILIVKAATFFRAIWSAMTLNFDGNIALSAQIACTFVVMQAYHIIALATTPLPMTEDPDQPADNDPSFVASIGVVVPCHKSAAEIGLTVRSLLDSGIQPHHIVIADNANLPAPPDDTEKVVKNVNIAVNYMYISTGLKTLALWKGVHALPESVSYVLHLDDDTVVPGAATVYDVSHFDDPRVAAVSYGIEIERLGPVEKLVDFEFRLWSHWRYFRAETATAWYCHGIVGLWRRDRFTDALRQHPFLPFGEDGWLGCIALGNDDRIAQEMRCAVKTFAPERLFQPCCQTFSLPTAMTFNKSARDPETELPLEVKGASVPREQGYGAANVWKQRTRRWFVNAPRRLHIRLLMWFTYNCSTLCGAILFRIELARHIALTLIVLLYPFFVARVIYDNTYWTLLALKGFVMCVDLIMYTLINYVCWYPHQRVGFDTVVLYPLYRMFLRFAQVIAHWRCILLYIPNNPMRTGRYNGATCDTIVPGSGQFSISALLDWPRQRALYSTILHEDQHSMYPGPSSYFQKVPSSLPPAPI